MTKATTKPKAGSRDKQREDTRRRLYEAAIATFRRDGVDAARVDDIVRAAGVSHGAFYFHFATKEDVLAQRLRESEVAVAAELEALPAEARLAQVLETVCGAIARQWEHDPELFPAVGAVALRSVSLRSEDRRSPVRAALADRFRRASEDRELSRMVPPELLADLLLVNLFAAALSWCAGRTLPLSTVLGGVAMLFVHGARGAPIS